jgi:parallel beta-helix repeat protein
MAKSQNARIRLGAAWLGDARVMDPVHRFSKLRIVLVLLVLGMLAAGLATGLISALLYQAERTPREWAWALRRDQAGEAPIIARVRALAALWLNRVDRQSPEAAVPLPAFVGADPTRSGVTPNGRLRQIASLSDLRDAIESAQPGDVIEIQPGIYRFAGRGLPFNQAGTPDAPITLRAATLGDVIIESDALETFKILAPFWRIENLTIRGVCADHTHCEHAIHVAGAATDTVIRNNRFEDFNAHIKVNGEDGIWPDNGVIEGNSFTNSAPRITRNPVTPIDVVGASRWRASRNIITDFVRGVPGEATYGGFFKGTGEDNIFERNLVLCEWKLRNVPGQQVGLSLGGGSTDPDLRRDKSLTGMEQIGGVIRDNLIAFCSDAGIYLNRSARSVVDHNTVLDTVGIDGRYLETAAMVTGNIVDGVVRERAGAHIRAFDNPHPLLPLLFLGYHPERLLFRDPASLDLSWRVVPDRLQDDVTRPDLCGRTRPVNPLPGAFEDYSACLAGQ